MAEKAGVHARTQGPKQKCSICNKKPSYNSSGSPADRILQFQRTAGNKAVQGLIKSGILQTKPRIYQPDNQHNPMEGKKDAISGGRCKSCNKKILQRAATGSASEFIPPIVHEVLSSPGQPLDSGTRELMEQHFGHDFSKVRVHMDTRATESAQAINALAYTIGNDVVFRSSAPSLQAPDRKKILVHELTHVIQQRPHAGAKDDLSIDKAGSAAEIEADRVAEEVANGRSVNLGINKVMSSSRIIQRLEGPCKDILEGHVVIKRGSIRPAVREAQRKLNLFHKQQIIKDKPGLTDAPLVPDCIFGDKTFNATLSFQKIVFPEQPEQHDAIIGNNTWAELDKTSGKTTDECLNEPDINSEVDPLPALPPFDIKSVSASEMSKLVKEMQPSELPLPSKVPLGASKPDFDISPVKVTALPVEGSNCMKCVADWNPGPSFKSFVISGSWADEPPRFAVFQQGDISGCPSTPIPHLLEVRKIILPEASRIVAEAEHEHYLDFVRAFNLTGGRYLANVRRLTPERTHLRAKDQSECEDKVSGFLSLMVQAFIPKGSAVYSLDMKGDFLGLYNPAGTERDKVDHIAVSQPPQEKLPIRPNIDLDINPFGCNAYFRKYGRKLLSGVPGKTSEALIKDLNGPPKKPWHAL